MSEIKRYWIKSAKQRIEGWFVPESALTAERAEALRPPKLGDRLLGKIGACVIENTGDGQPPGAEGEMSEIKRYCPEVGYPDHFAGMVESNEGAWVRYEDHQAALTAERARAAELGAAHDEAVSDYNELARQLLTLRQAVREKAREWEGSELIPADAIVDEKTRYLAGVREGIRRERKRCAAELSALEKDHAGLNRAAQETSHDTD